MTVHSEYLAWAASGGANVEDYATYLADAARANGHSAGIARSIAVNTTLRQASVVSAAVAQMIVDSLGITMADDGDVSNFKTQLIATLQALGIPAATASDLWAGTNNTKFATALALKNATAFQTLTYASTVAWNMNLGFGAKVTLAGNPTIGQPTNLQEGATIALGLFQDGTGSRVPSWASCWDWGSAGAPTLSTGANKQDWVFGIVTDASTPKIRANFSKSA